MLSEILYNIGALDGGGGGSPMSHVEFKKWLCQLSLFFNFNVDLKMVPCRMSNLRNGLCHVDNIFSHVDKLHVACRFKKMVISPCQI